MRIYDEGYKYGYVPKDAKYIYESEKYALEYGGESFDEYTREYFKCRACGRKTDQWYWIHVFKGIKGVGTNIKTSDSVVICSDTCINLFIIKELM